MKRLFYLARKDVAVLLSDKANLFWVIGFPVVFALFFGLVFSGTSGGDGAMNLKVGLVDLDQSVHSQRFAEDLRAEEAVELMPMSKDQAREAVRKGKVTAALIINDHFSANNGLGFGGGNSALQIMADPSCKMQTAYLQGIVTKTRFTGFSDFFTDPDRAEEQFAFWKKGLAEDASLNPLLRATYLTFFDSLENFTDQLRESDAGARGMDDFMAIQTVGIQVEEAGGDRPAEGFQVTLPQCILWGIIGCVATFAVSIVREQTSGTFARLCVGPVRKAHILAGKGLACFFTSAMVVTFLYLLAKLLFQVSIDNLLYFVMAVFCTIVCFVGIMMLVCTLGRTEQAVGAAGWGLLMIMSMLGGGMMPLIFMPKWMQDAGAISPVKWGIYAMEGAVWRHFSLAEMLVPCGVLLGIGILFFAIGATILGRRSS